LNEDVLERLDRLEAVLAELTRVVKASHTRRALKGWKAISEYCGKSPRTLYRYQMSYGFPVFRWGPNVFSTVGLVEDWLMQHDSARRARKDKEKGNMIATEKEKPNVSAVREQGNQPLASSRR